MKFLRILPLVGLFFLGSCGLLDLEGQLDNPNEVGAGNLDVNLLMNQIQMDFADFVAVSNVPTMELTRMMALTGGDTYERAYQAQSFNSIWNRAYQDVLVQIKQLTAVTDGTGLTAHSGTARVLQAYTMMTLVDLFGDVPYSEALRGDEEIFNPAADQGATIYTAAIAVLDEAIALLGETPSSALSRDIYYGGNRTKWTALANTLKLKAYMNLRLTNSATAKTNIETLLSADLIDTDAEEFTYKYGTADVPARSRHPLYLDMYRVQAGSAENYLGNHFMLSAYNQKGVEDPRWRYYFYRQVGSITKALDDNTESIPCVISPRPSHYTNADAWCAFDPGFFGRDHGNSDGLPPDQRAKTCVGVYPAGGRADLNDGDVNYQVVTSQGQGANGAGIEPIWMASFTDFLKAEAVLTLGVAGDAKALMNSGVTASIARVRAFAASKSQSLTAGLEASETDYSNAVSAAYDAATTDDARLNVVMKEYYLALWGNGIEAYNMYRRTGKPSDMQPMRSANAGNFIRSFLYPADHVNLNSNATQKTNGAVNKVFWDNNPDNFIK